MMTIIHLYRSIKADRENMENNEPGQLLTQKEVADYFKVTILTVHNWRKKGLPFYKIGSVVRFDFVDVKNWVDQKRIKGTGK